MRCSKSKCEGRVVPAGDLSELLLTDEELCQASGCHFVRTLQLDPLDSSTRSSLGLRELTPCEFLGILERLQQVHGVAERKSALLSRGGIFFDALFSYLWRHRAVLGIQDMARGQATGRVDDSTFLGGLLLRLNILPLRHVQPRSLPSHAGKRVSGGEADASTNWGGGIHVVVGALQDAAVVDPAPGADFCHTSIFLGASTHWVVRAAASCGLVRFLHTPDLSADSSRAQDSEEDWCDCFSPLCPTCMNGFRDATSTGIEHGGHGVGASWSADSVAFLEAMGVKMVVCSSRHLEDTLVQLGVACRCFVRSCLPASAPRPLPISNVACVMQVG